MRLTFKNKNGRITMGGKGTDTFAIKSVTGLGVCNKNYDTISYYGCDGKTTLASFMSSRIITVAFDISDSSQNAVKNAVKVLFHDGSLTVTENGIKRKINYKPLSLEKGEKNGHIQSMVFQAECDDPYFKSVYEKTFPLFSKTKNISSPFTLPAVFSSRTRELVVINQGDVKTYPKIELVPLTDKDTLYVFKIKNETTGEEINFSIDTKPNELITIDTEKRLVTSSLKGNIANTLTSGVLGNMYIDTGKNKIRLIPQDTKIPVKCHISYSLKYLEAL